MGNADELINVTQTGSCIYANSPGDGSAREQAASCQKVLGGLANICHAFATKRYRSNCINWGILPFTLADGVNFDGREGDYVFVPGVRSKLASGDEQFDAVLLRADGTSTALMLYITGLTDEEKAIILDGCLMNHCKKQMEEQK